MICLVLTDTQIRVNILIQYEYFSCQHVILNFKKLVIITFDNSLTIVFILLFYYFSSQTHCIIINTK